MDPQLFYCEHTNPEPYLCPRCPFKTTALILLRTHIIDSHSRNCDNNATPVDLYQNPIRKFICLGCSYPTHSLFLGLKHEIECLSDLSRCMEEFFECALCTHITKRKQNLKNHYISKHVDDTKIQWIKCDYCDYKTKFRDNLQKHWKKHYRIKFRCNKCPFKTNNFILFQQHRQIKHTNIQWFHCDKCKFSSRYETSLKHHYFFKHVENSDIFDCQRTKLTPYLCSKCPFQTDVLMLLNIHVGQTHSEIDYGKISIKNYICDCSWESHSRLLSLRHKNQCRNEIRTIQDHVGLENGDLEIEWFQCDRCAYKTKHKNDLQIHLNLHHNKENLFYCAHCDYKTEVKKNLPPHIKRRHPNETNDPWLKCYQCDYSTKLRENLLKHIKYAHLNETEWFKCDRCSYTTKRKTNMKLHSLKHSDQVNTDWSQCDQCDYKTRIEERLMSHIKQKHDKQNNHAVFKCEHCQYEATQRRYLINHVNTVHPHESKAPWIQCDLCNYATKSRDSLTKHIKCKHADKRFVCDKCPFSTKHERNLRKHKVVKHEDVTPIQWLECDQCDFESNSEKKMARHKISIHSREWLECRYCEFKTKLKAQLERHRRVHSRMFQCDYCYFKNKTKKDLVAHLSESHRGEAIPEWLRCDHSDCTSQTQHLTKHSLVLMKDRNATKKPKMKDLPRPRTPPQNKKCAGDGPELECDKCAFTTRYRVALETHKLLKHNEIV